MYARYLSFLALLAIQSIFIQCKTPVDDIALIQKAHSNDPFRKTMVPSQIFKIDAQKENVLEGKDGTLFVLPKGCFKDARGKMVEGDVEIELAEALKLDDMILSNLTTTSNGELLETGGMIYFNATANGKQLKVNESNPVYIEIPTSKKIPGMMAYKGERDENGNMNWIEPKPLETFLVPVDLEQLDFLPQGFAATVEMGMPFRGHKHATKELVDSLYYGLSFTNLYEIGKYIAATEYNEPHYNPNRKIENGEYTEESYYNGQVGNYQNASDTMGHPSGIDPALIKTIKSSPYQNTLIATREFETRLRYIFRTCQNPILELYINNLDKNLWELDSMATAAIAKLETPVYESDLIGYNTLNKEDKEHLVETFRSFSQQKLTTVKDGSKYGELLKGYYEKRVAEVRSELEATQQKFIKELQEKQAAIEQVAGEYRELLWKREKFRMEKNGFTWTETGWINIDVGTIPKSWAPQKLEILVENGQAYDQVYTYVIYTSIKSLYRLNTSDSELFYVGNENEREMDMPKKEIATAISIAYKSEQSFLAVKEFETKSQRFSISLALSSQEEIQKAISKYDSYATENRIDEDLKYMAILAEEKKRQKQVRSERDFIEKIGSNAFVCGFYLGEL